MAKQLLFFFCIAEKHCPVGPAALHARDDHESRLVPRRGPQGGAAGPRPPAATELQKLSGTFSATFLRRS